MSDTARHDDAVGAARALLADGLEHETASRIDQPACTCNGASWCEPTCPALSRVDRAAVAESWFDENRRRLLDCCAAALNDADRHIAELSSALTALIARVRRTGGYADPEEQDVLRQAERALASVAEKASAVPVAAFSPDPATDTAGRPSGRSGGGR